MLTVTRAQAPFLGISGGGTVTYTSSQTAQFEDSGKLVILACNCTYTIFSQNMNQSFWWVEIMAAPGYSPTLALGSGETFNGGTNVPGLSAYTPLIVRENTATATDFDGSFNSGSKHFNFPLITYWPTGKPESFAGNGGQFFTSSPIIITRVTALATNTAPVGCSVYATVGVFTASSGSNPSFSANATARVTFSGGNASADSGAISVFVPANTWVSLGVITDETGCSTSATNVDVSLEYQ